MNDIKTHGVIVTFGKHIGEPITRVPVGYLKYMVNNGTPQSVVARAEIARRGSKIPEVELSAHAVDNASIRCRKIWHDTKKDGDEGIYTWLERMTLLAIQHGVKLQSGKIKYNGMKFVIEQGEEFPVLKTIMR